jgi:hypothetical protein
VRPAPQRAPGLLAAAAVAVVTLAVAAGCAGGGEGSAPPVTPPPGTPAPSDLATGELWFSELDLTGAGVVGSEGRLQDLRMTGRDVLAAGGALHAASVEADAVVPFEEVAAQVGPDVTVEPAEDGDARIIRTVQVLGVGVDVSGTGEVRAEDGMVVVTPTTVDVGGPVFVERALGSAVDRLVTIRHPVEGLPPGLVLREVEVVDDGFAVHLTGEDVRLSG